MTALDQSELRIRVVHDHDGECSVTAVMKSGPFCGSGRAWLDIADVSQFALSVRQMAETSLGQATLRGGYINPDGSPNPTVDLRFSPHGRRGHILLIGELASDPAAVHVHQMSGAIIVEPAALERFASQLSNIPKGTEIEAVLLGADAA